jgi:branched-chain amino acid transport system substrate-binding protein
VQAIPAAQLKNQYDIFTSSPAVPAANESLEVIATQGDEIECKL